MANIHLTLACGDYEIVRALKEGTVKVDGVDLTVLTDIDSSTRHWRWAMTIGIKISATGPVVGYRGNLAGDNPTGQGINPGLVEREVLAAHNVNLEDFRHVGALKVKGTRRPLRFKLERAGLLGGKDDRGEFLELAFEAPSGCYATVVLGEIMKNPG